MRTAPCNSTLNHHGTTRYDESTRCTARTKTVGDRGRLEYIARFLWELAPSIGSSKMFKKSTVGWVSSDNATSSPSLTSKRPLEKGVGRSSLILFFCYLAQHYANISKWVLKWAWHKWRIKWQMHLFFSQRGPCSWSRCQCVTAIIVPFCDQNWIARRRNVDHKENQGNNAKHETIYASWPDRIHSIQSIQSIQSIHHHIHVISRVDALMALDFPWTFWHLSSFRAYGPVSSGLLAETAENKWQPQVSTGFHRFPHQSHGIDGKIWNQQKAWWDFLIGSWYSVMLRPTSVKFACVLSSAECQFQLLLQTSTLTSPFCISVCRVCHVPKMCPGCLVLVSPSCIMLHLKLALKQHSAEQGALQRREAFAASEWLYILIYSYCVTQRPMLWQSVKSFHVNWIAQDKPVTPKWD